MPALLFLAGSSVRRSHLPQGACGPGRGVPAPPRSPWACQSPVARTQSTWESSGPSWDGARWGCYREGAPLLQVPGVTGEGQGSAGLCSLLLSVSIVKQSCLALSKAGNEQTWHLCGPQRGAGGKRLRLLSSLPLSLRGSLQQRCASLCMAWDTTVYWGEGLWTRSRGVWVRGMGRRCRSPAGSRGLVRVCMPPLLPRLPSMQVPLHGAEAGGFWAPRHMEKGQAAARVSMWKPWWLPAASPPRHVMLWGAVPP